MKSGKNIWLPLAALVADMAALVLGAWLAYAVRFSESVTSQVPIYSGLPLLEWYIRLSLVLAGLVAFLMLGSGMYKFPRQEGLFEELSETFKRFLYAYTLLLAGLFFYRGVSFSRITMGLLFAFCLGGLLVTRAAGRWVRQELYRSGIAVRRAAIVGEGKQAEQIYRHLAAHPEYGMTLVGGIADHQPAVADVRHLGRLENAGQIIRNHKLEALIITPSASEPDPVPGLAQSCYGINIAFYFIPEILPVNGHMRRMVTIGGMPLWALKEVPFAGWPGLVKRSFDLVVAGIALLCALPLMTLVAAATKLDSRGPVIFRQKRVGVDGYEFDCLKFRSMKVDAEADTGAVWAVKDDPRVTRVGAILRRWSLDELPQLWNVLRGDMSLVGPRPERPEFVAQFARRIDGYHERHRVRTGLTGWAQVNGLRGDTPIEDRTIYDRYYVENWSLLFDVRILLMTFAAIVKGENSY